MRTDSPDCFRRVWKWASVLLYFTRSLMCDITNGSARVLLQLAHRKRARREGVMKDYLWWSLSLGCWAQCNVSDEHYAFMPFLLRRETRNIIHACFMSKAASGRKNPPFQGGISDIQWCRKLIGFNHVLQSRIYKKCWTRLMPPSLNSREQTFPVGCQLFKPTHCFSDRCLRKRCVILKRQIYCSVKAN